MFSTAGYQRVEGSARVLSYIDDHLIREEEVLYEGRISIWSLSGLICLGVLGTAFVFFKSLWATAPFLLGIAAFSWAVIKFASTELVVTNKRVVAKYGWVARRTVEISLGKVEGVEVQQTMVERMLGFGSVFVSGTGSHKARITNVHDPMSFRAAFLEALDKHEQQEIAPTRHASEKECGTGATRES